MNALNGITRPTWPHLVEKARVERRTALLAAFTRKPNMWAQRARSVRAARETATALEECIRYYEKKAS